MKTIKNFPLVVISCFAFASCAVPVSYIGDKLPATDSVNTYYSAHDVKRDYKVIGHMSYPNTGFDVVKAKFLEFAKTVGADAIIIGNTEAGKQDLQAVIDADAIKYK